MTMRWLRVVAATLVLVAAIPAGAADREPAEEIQPRVDHHIRAAAVLARHFDTLVAAECPRFATPAEWLGYFKG